METQEILHNAGCEMEVVCFKKWHDLEKTDEDGIRFCGDCKQLVFFTSTATELRVAAERGLCVYIVPENSANRDHRGKPYQSETILRERIRKIAAKSMRRLIGPTLGVPIIR